MQTKKAPKNRTPQVRCLAAVDALHEPVFHVEQQPHPLPHVLCPHAPLTFSSDLTMPTAVDDASESSHDLSEVLCAGLTSVSIDAHIRLGMPTVTAHGDEERTLVWDAQFEAALAVVLDAPAEGMRRRKLRVLGCALGA